MILVRNQTSSVPVPEVFNAYSIDDVGFTVMAKVLGITLEACWRDFSHDVKVSITTQLAEYIQHWRQVQGHWYGTVNAGPCQDVVFYHPWEPKQYEYGPYSTRREFNAGMSGAL